MISFTRSEMSTLGQPLTKENGLRINKISYRNEFQIKQINNLYEDRSIFRLMV